MLISVKYTPTNCNTKETYMRRKKNQCLHTPVCNICMQFVGYLTKTKRNT